MAAPERFADRSDSSCTAGTVHTWPITTCSAAVADGRFPGQSGLWEVVRPSASMSSRPSLVAVVMKHARRHYYLLWGWR